MGEDDCLFCKIASGDVSGDVVYEDDDLVAFRDIDPQAPTHVLVIPREHVPSVNHLERGHAEVVGKLYLAARDLARQEGVADDGYRLVMNTGSAAGQSVPHIHLHLLGGRDLAWPPG